MALKIDLDELTNGDIIEIEERTGMSFSDIGAALKDGGKPVGKLLAALTLIDMRTTNPAATWEDALLVKPLKDAGEAVPVDPPVPPSATTA
jgi:hypothetical protein